MARVQMGFDFNFEVYLQALEFEKVLNSILDQGRQVVKSVLQFYFLLKGLLMMHTYFYSLSKTTRLTEIDLEI